MNSKVPDSTPSPAREGFVHGLKAEFRKALLSKPGQFFIRHSGKIAGISFGIMNASFLLKDFIQSARPPNHFEQIAGAVMLLQNGMMALVDRHPEMKKAAGIALISGAVLLGLGGMHTAGQTSQLVASGLLMGKGAALMVNKRSLPFMTATAGGDSIGKLFLMNAAVLNHDPGKFLAAIMGVIGNLGTIGCTREAKAHLVPTT